ncbi:MXAN_2562 family outer membrane beta-barrel protein [Anaeromyxobacter oryzisoli]|uniref:MXAN_2562 family outer membrane beta-barrel protein n=1 Tax=Anaeromyxobacter oryzisoli TaxID=2925408 RepID=UPI001F56A9AA|nr:MXAN_2562 family outer membrane beta-barrel protein [Anaeromyxobacter sp. SG63]
MRRSHAGALRRRAGLVLAALALAAAARADEPAAGEPEVTVPPSSREDPPLAQAADGATRRATGLELSLRAQSYRPAIDREFDGAAQPFGLAFGSGRRWGGRLELAKTLATSLGTAGLGLGVGYFGASGHGLYQDTSTGALLKSGDSTSLHVIPISLFATYRLDLLSERLHVPLAPYARVAVERYAWIATGTSHASKLGATDGYSLTAGVALYLDGVDPVLAQELRRESGIEHTALTFDVTRAIVDDFGSARSWDLSTVGWALAGGLLVTF